MKSFFRRLMMVVFLLFLGLIAVGVTLIWNANRKVSARLDALREVGKPATIAELGETNRFTGNAQPLQQHEAVMTSMGNFVSQETGDAAADRAVRVKIFRSLEQQHPELAAKLRQLAQVPTGQTNLDLDTTASKLLNQLMSNAQLYRSAARVLANHADAELADGNTDAAILDVIAILQWAEHVSHEPTLVSHLVGLAIRDIGIEIAARALYRGDASADMRTQLTDTIEQFDRVAAWTRAIDSERVLGQALMLENMGRLSLVTATTGDNITMLETMEVFEKLGAQPFGTDPGHLQSGVFSATLLPSMQSSIVAERRVQAKSQAVLILATWQEAPQDPPAGIESLGFPKSVTTDPFDGSLMKLKSTPAGPIIYSVGRDGVDDGGSVADENDAGIAP